MEIIKKTGALFLFMFVLGIGYGQKETLTVSGNVSDEEGIPLPGVVVVLQGSSLGTNTDFDGNYTLDIPKNEDNVLLFSYLSFEDKTVEVKGNEDEDAVIDVSLKSSESLLEEVIVVGFGTIEKENLTGAVSQVGEEVFDSRPIISADKALQGVIPGLNISTDRGGELNESLNINIRGIGTIGTGSSGQPLVLIDGVEGDLSSVNPNDIKTVSVLKDASAAAIYGSRAPFGVILVTTKSGEGGKMKVTYSNSFRFSTPIDVPDRMNSLEYAYFLNDLYENSGKNKIYNDNRIRLIKDYRNGDLAFGTEPNASGTEWVLNRSAYGDTDWYNVHLKKWNLGLEHNLSVNGGSERITYYVSTNYLNQEGIFNYADENFNRLTLNSKIGVKLSPQLELNLNTRFMRKKHNKPSAQDPRFYHNLSRAVPTSPLFSPYGDYMENAMVQQLEEGGRLKEQTDFLYNTLKLTYEPLKDWKIYGTLNTRIENRDDTKHIARISVIQPTGKSEYIPVFSGYNPAIETRGNGIFAITAPGQNYFQVNGGQNNYLATDLYTDYLKSFGKHNLKFLLGMQSELFSSHYSQLGTDNIESDNRPFISQNGEKFVYESKGEWSNLGFFTRINYNYKNKYLVEANFRADGASRFPSDDRWGYFPSFSVGWNLAKEDFWKENITSRVNELKFRGSWGILGNQNTNSFYPYFQNMSIQNGNWVVDGSVPSVLYAPKPFSSSITWEKVISYNYGLDLSAFNNRLTSTIDIFNRTTKDMVGPAPLKPETFGTVVPNTNNAELESKGWEFSLGWRDNIGKDFSYDAKIVLSDVKTKVTGYSNPERIFMVNGQDQYYEGKQIGEIWGYQSAGIAQSDKEMKEWLMDNKPSFGTDWAGGDIKYKDLNGDGVVNDGAQKVGDSGDMTVIGNNTPRYHYGLNLGFTYKIVDFGIFIQGVGKRDAILAGGGFYPGVNEWQLSPYSAHLDYFRAYGAELGENLNSYYPRPYIGDKNYKPQTHFLQDASYLRIKNLQVGITIPRKIATKWGIENLRLFVSGENLYTYTKLKMFDPEGLANLINGSGKTYPMSATYSAGLRITF